MPSEQGIWEHISHPEECDCGHEAHHKHHLVVASHFENSLERAEFANVRNRVFASDDVIVTSDPAVIKIMQQEDMVASEV